MKHLTSPALDNPAPCWKYDLPNPNHTPTTTPYPSGLSNPPNHVDNIHLELPSSTSRMRGVNLYIAACLICISITSLMLGVAFILLERNTPPFVLCLGISISFIVHLWLGVYVWRMDVESPRDQPIRFNRLRRKVYVYRF
ncbi:DUF6708 domain-containing protein, partial [Pseudomonas sp. LF19]|uniref:DUF6708 domain-containing protein n=1 Tax=Pseudomonas sp. LF19 TaxID=2899115 RepID=UPI003FA35FB2